MSASGLTAKKKLEQDIAVVERQLFDLETRLLSEPYNIAKGFEGFHKFNASATKTSTAPPPPEQRIFSLSSHTSPAARK